MNRLAGWSVIAICGAISGAPAIAQMVYPIQLTGQPLMHLKDGKLRACGVRVFGVHTVAANQPLTVVDGSFTLESSGVGLIKLTSSIGVAQEVLAGKAKNQKVVNGWFKAAGHPAAVPEGRKVAGEDGLSLLYVTSGQSTMNLLEAQLGGKTISMAIRRDLDNTDKIFTGIVVMEPAETKQLLACLQELVSQTKP
jgi:hypothetical protein